MLVGKDVSFQGCTVSLLPCSSFSFRPLSIPRYTLSPVYFSIHERCMDRIYPLGRSLPESTFKIKVFYLYYLNSRTCTSNTGWLASFSLEYATVLLINFQAVNIHMLNKTITTLFYHYKLQGQQPLVELNENILATKTLLFEKCHNDNTSYRQIQFCFSVFQNIIHPQGLN